VNPRLSAIQNRKPEADDAIRIDHPGRRRALGATAGSAEIGKAIMAAVNVKDMLAFALVEAARGRPEGNSIGAEMAGTLLARLPRVVFVSSQRIAITYWVAVHRAMVLASARLEPPRRRTPKPRR
jgi:hypothetical protein